MFRDLSQVVGRTPQDTPVPSYTRTSPFPQKIKSGSVTVTVIVIDSEKMKPVTVIPSFIMREDFRNYEVGIGNLFLIPRQLKLVRVWKR